MYEGGEEDFLQAELDSNFPEEYNKDKEENLVRLHICVYM